MDQGTCHRRCDSTSARFNRASCVRDITSNDPEEHRVHILTGEQLQRRFGSERVEREVHGSRRAWSAPVWASRCRIQPKS